MEETTPQVFLLKDNFLFIFDSEKVCDLPIVTETINVKDLEYRETVQSHNTVRSHNTKY